MRQLIIFALNLIIIAWLRGALVVRKGLPRRQHPYIEVGFGILLALPLIIG